METAEVFDPLGEERLTRAGRIDEAEVEGTRSEPRDLLGIEALGMSRGDAATREIVTQGAEPTSLDLVRENQTPPANAAAWLSEQTNSRQGRFAR